MNNFDKLLSEELDDALPITGEAKGKLDLINEISKELEKTKQRLSELEIRLRHAVEEYNIELAKALRQRIPAVSINLNNGRCSAAYKSTKLSCRPDIDNNIWVFDPNPHGRRFTRMNGASLRLTNTVDHLADAIVSYLSTRYKSLR